MRVVVIEMVAIGVGLVLFVVGSKPKPPRLR